MKRKFKTDDVRCTYIRNEAEWQRCTGVKVI